MLLDGMHLPLTTPFLPDGQLNSRKLEDNVRRYSKTPAAGLVALAKSGQPNLLSDVETREVLRVVAETATPEKVLTAGVRRDSVIGTLELIAYAAQVGFDVALVPVPSILHRGGRSVEVLSFFRAIADASELPVLLDSGATGDGEIAVELAIELAEHRNIIGMLGANGDASRVSAVLKETTSVRREVLVTPVFAAVTRRMLAQASQPEAALMPVEMLSQGGTALSAGAPAMKTAIKTRTKTVAFQLLCGRTLGVLDALLAGAVGSAPPLAAAAPQACYEVIAAWKDGDPALAAEKQDRLRLLAARVEEQLGVAGIKYGCDLNGYFGGRPRLPKLPLTGTQRAEIERLMAGVRS